MIPPKPATRPRRVRLWRYLRLFRQDILASQPAHLYRARMAEFRTPFFRSYLINEPHLIDLLLKERPRDFPKSGRIAEGLRPLLGGSVFLTNGAVWERQRRIIDPAFEGGRLRDTFPAMWDAGTAAVARLGPRADGTPVEIEAETSHAAADVIFRTLFSIPITHHLATEVFARFRAYQRRQPLLNLAAFIPLPRWLPRFHARATRQNARAIRALIERLTAERMAAICEGRAPDDLAEKAAAEAAAVLGDTPDFAAVARLTVTRDIFREALRLYPPVPMMVRETTRPERFRDRNIAPGAQIVLSPWHLHRHERHWQNPDAFDPGRWATEEGRASARCAWLPFSAGPRVCTGAGFAMIEGPLLLAMILRAFRLSTVPGHAPVPVAHLTVRARDGIHLALTPRQSG
ncbi:MAG: cytochrome P450 [Alphaproteobacteria bacterium HGW-Alphaproteobacteria-2]|nr:MAG: cytochrome P450 [Alphaproteobacteria bacterium HGW-Alphaproteobacteria-2]